MKCLPAVSLILLLTISLFSAAPVFATGSYNILHSFNPTPYGYQPEGTLVADAAGNFYGVAVSGGPYNQGEIFELSSNSGGGYTLKLIYGFRNGEGPDTAGLAIDSAGNLYGTGFDASGGMVYALQPTGDGTWKFSILFSGFTQPQPFEGVAGPLAVDSAGNLYGETRPGLSDFGYIFEVSRSGAVWNMTVLHNFSGGTDGSDPWGGLIVDKSNNLYGVALGGGVSGGGVAFELSQTSGATWTETVLHSFNGNVDGSGPDTRLVFDSTGNLYGATSHSPGCSGFHCGTVFKLAPGSNGQWTESLVYNLGLANNGVGNGATGLVFDSAGNLYGTTDGDGVACAQSTVFELSPDNGGPWTATVLYTFHGSNDACGPSAVVMGPRGQLFGVGDFGGGPKDLGVIFEVAIVEGEWQERILTNFNVNNDGEYPQSSLITDAAGNLYGTTVFGGANGSGQSYGGAVFELTPSSSGGWTGSTIYSVGVLDYDPIGLTLDSRGDLLGTYYNELAGYEAFELTPASGGGWTEQDIFTFTHAFPSGGSFAIDSSGNLYGTDTEGNGFGGAVYELSRSTHGNWKRTTIHEFQGAPGDGKSPVGGVVFDAAGNLYGTTKQGGASIAGSVFELSPITGGGWSEQILYSFTNSGGDGATPLAGLIMDSAGNLYGTTSAGGGRDCRGTGCGTVFELSPTTGGAWTETILHTFSDTGTDGQTPEAPLVMDQDGNLYGTTYGGGGNSCSANSIVMSCGTVFELSPSAGGVWNETILHAFTGQNGRDGSNPEGGLIFGRNGLLYGSTFYGGTTNQGTVFSIAP